ISAPSRSVPSRRRMLAIAAAAAVGIAMAAVGAWLGARFTSQPAPLPARFVLAPPPSLPLFLQWFNRDIVISPDGSHIVYRSATGSAGGSVCAVRGINDVTPGVVGGTGAINGSGTEPFMSPDGRWLGYSSAGELRKISMAGGPPITIGKVASNLRGAFW